MRPTDLYLEVARHKAAGLWDSSPEQEARYEQAREELRSRAALVFDRFEAAGEVASEVLLSDPTDARDQFRVAKKIFEFELPAPEALADLVAPYEQAEITIYVTIGCHDVSHSADYGATWSEPSRCRSLDVLTTVLKYEDDDDYDYDVLQRLERMNYMYPVLDDYRDPDSTDRIPERDHFSPDEYTHKIEGVHGALDLADQYLAQKGNT